jgi:hypothetical protein
VLELLFDEFYNDKLDNFESHQLRTFYNSYVSNLSMEEESFYQTQAVLKRIKEKLIKKESDLFYINLLIEDSKNSYINSKSKPYGFLDARRIANNVAIL